MHTDKGVAIIPEQGNVVNADATSRADQDRIVVRAFVENQAQFLREDQVLLIKKKADEGAEVGEILREVGYHLHAIA